MLRPDGCLFGGVAALCPIAALRPWGGGGREERRREEEEVDEEDAEVEDGGRGRGKRGGGEDVERGGGEVEVVAKVGDFLRGASISMESEKEKKMTK